jgi:hypothetical protein
MRKLKKVQTDFRRRNADAATEGQFANSNVNGNGSGNSFNRADIPSAPVALTIANFGKAIRIPEY